MIQTNQYNKSEEKAGNFENKILDINCFVTNTFPNTKIGEVGNKISDVSKLVKKIGYDAKISQTEEKYLTTFDYNKFKNHMLDAQVKQKNLVNESNISHLIKNSTLNRKLES